MNCQEVSDNIYAYCDGTLSPLLEGDICLHLTVCSACRHNYGLTMTETSTLHDTLDIPSLSASFTAQVLSCLGANSPGPDQKTVLEANHRISMPFRPKAWQNVSVAAAAVIIGLFLYGPHLSKSDNQVDVASKKTSLNQPELIVPEAPAPAPTVPIKLAAAPPAAAGTQTRELSNSTVPEVKPVPSPEVSVLPSVNKTVTSIAAQSNRTLSSDQLSSGGLAVGAPPPAYSSFSPQNIPNNFKLVAVDDHGLGQTVYNYVSLDQKQSLRLMVVDSAGSPSPVIGNSPTRIIQLGNQQITVTFSGNLPVPELELLANTIVFADTTATNTN